MKNVLIAVLVCILIFYILVNRGKDMIIRELAKDKGTGQARSPLAQPAIPVNYKRR